MNLRLPAWLVAALICLVVRGVWMLAVHPEPVADSAFYFTRGIELADGLGYRYAGHPTAFFPVGSSLILAGPFRIFGPSLVLAELMSLLAWTASTVLVFQLGRLLAGTATGFAAALIVALHPDLIAFGALVASENFFVPFLLASLYTLCLAVQAGRPRARLMVLAGVLFGLALLVRSTALILLPLFALLLLFSGRKLREGLLAALLFGGATALVLAPWVARNAVAMGQPLLTSNGGISLWWGNNPNASGGFPLSGPAPVQDLSSVQSELASNAHFSAEAFAFIRDNPREWLLLVPAKLAYLFASPAPDIGFWLRHRYAGGPWAVEFHHRLGDPSRAAEAAYLERELGPVESRFIGAYYRVAGGVNGLLLQRGLWLLGLAGLVLLWLREAHSRRLSALLILVSLAWLLFHATLGNGQPRYLLSVAPLAALGLGYLGVTLMALRRGRPVPEALQGDRP